MDGELLQTQKQHGATYQSSTTSNDILRSHTYADYNDNVSGYPLRGDTYDNQFEMSSRADNHGFEAESYRFAQSIHPTWFADNFDWQTEQDFEVSRFEAQFGMSYEAGVKSLPSYDESRVIYGR